MAKFYVGQRVRVIGAVYHHDHIGREGTVLDLAGDHTHGHSARVLIDNTPCIDSGNGAWSVLYIHLAPLSDPKADAFIALIRQLKPLTVRETA